MQTKTFFSVSILITILLITGCTNPSATNWFQYTGPNRNATISGAGMPLSWPEGGPEAIWSFPLGQGYGGASIYNEEVFILDRENGERDILRCIDFASGKEKWSYSYNAPGELPYPGSRAVPTVTENYVYSVGPHGQFYCFDKESGQPEWNINILEKFEAELPHWGVSQSPLIYGDLVIIAPQGQKAGVVAFNRITGEIVWESRALTGHPFHVSPYLASYGGIDQVIMISPYSREDSTKTHEVAAFHANSGKELWTYMGLKSYATIAPPVAVDDKRLFLTDCSYDGSYKPVSIMLEISRNGESFEVKEHFKTEEAGCKMHPGIVHDNHIYLNNNGRPNRLVCMTMDGDLLWEKESAPNLEMGSLILADGVLIGQNGKNGDIHLIAPSPEGYRELGKAPFFDSSKSQAWSPLAISRGRLIARDLGKMVCIDFRQ